MLLFQLSLDAEGHVVAERSSAIEGQGGKRPTEKISIILQSSNKVSFDKWNSIVVTYDFKKVSLYLNQQLEDEKTRMRAHEMIDCQLIILLMAVR